MRLLFCLIGVGLITHIISAQTLKTIPLGNNKTIEFSFDWADVTFINGDEDRIAIEGLVNINEGENNASHRIEVQEKSDRIEIETFIENVHKLPKWIKVRAKGKDYTFKHEGEKQMNRENIKKKLGVEEIEWTNYGPLIDIQLIVKIPRGKQIAIKSKYGDIVLDRLINGIHVTNTYGHVLAKFDQPLGEDCNITSTYSFVDVSIRENARLDLALHTQYGEIFTDLNFEINHEASLDKPFNSKIMGSLNNGGNGLNLKATYNNVYLRKL